MNLNKRSIPIQIFLPGSLETLRWKAYRSAESLQIASGFLVWIVKVYSIRKMGATIGIIMNDNSIEDRSWAKVEAGRRLKNVTRTVCGKGN